MKTWAQYIWHGYRNQWLLFLTFQLIPLSSLVLHYFNIEDSATLFSTIGFSALLFGNAFMSKAVIYEFSSNERLQLIPQMLQETRYFLLQINVIFLLITLFIFWVLELDYLNFLFVAWATFSSAITWHFLSYNKTSAILFEALIIASFFIGFLSGDTSVFDSIHPALPLAIIGTCYLLILKGRRHSSTSVVKSRPNIRHPMSSSPIRYTSPKVLFRLFGLFGLQQSMLTYWVSLFALCYIGITVGLVFAPDSANAFLIISTLGIALIASHLPFFEEDIQIKSIKPWALIPITHNRTDFTKRLLKDALLSHLKLIFPINLLLPLILSNNLDLAFSLAIVTTVMSLLCAAFAWLSITKRWKPLFPAIASIILLFASWLLATKFSGELILLAAFSIVACALAFWLYKLAYRSLALVDWH